MCGTKITSGGHPNPALYQGRMAALFIGLCFVVGFYLLGTMIHDESTERQHFEDECHAHARGVVVKYQGALACADEEKFLMRASEPEHHHEH